VESLFWVFLVMIPLERFGCLSSTGRALPWLGISFVLYLSGVGTEWLSIDGAIYLFPYFLAGLLTARFGHALNDSKRIYGWAVLAALAVLVYANAEQLPTSPRTAPALAIGLITCVSLLLTRLHSPLLAAIGIYSYSIYLFHVFGTAASRIVLAGIGVESTALLLACGIAAGIALPILVDRVASRSDLGRRLLLGKGKGRPRPGVVPVSSGRSGRVPFRREPERPSGADSTSQGRGSSGLTG